MKLNGRISQIRPSFSDMSYMNISEVGTGGISVWCHTKYCPTYLARQKGFVYLIHFDSKEWAKEWLDENRSYYEYIEQINDNKEIHLTEKCK